MKCFHIVYICVYACKDIMHVFIGTWCAYDVVKTALIKSFTYLIVFCLTRDYKLIVRKVVDLNLVSTPGHRDVI